MTENAGGRLAARLLGRMPLGRLLSLLFAAIVVVTAAAVGGILFASGRVAVRAAVSELRRDTVATVRQYLDDYLALPERVNAGNLLLARQGLLPLDDPDRLLRYLNGRGQTFPGFGTIAFANSEGEFFGANQPENYIVLASRRLTGGAIRRYAPAEDGGRGARVLGDRPDYDARERSWYRAAVAAGQPTWTDIGLSVTRPRLDLSAVAPWLDPDGRERGVFLVDVSLSQLNEYLGSISLGRRGTVFIVERTGDLVASSTRQPPFVNAGGEPARVERLRAVASPDPVIAAAARVLLAGPRSPDNAVRSSFPLRGETYVLAADRYTRGGSIDWLIAAAIPEAEFTGGIRAANRTAAALTLLVALAAIGLGTLTARWVVGPLERLTEAARDLSEGRWEIPVAPGRNDEVGALARSFAQMGARLGQTVARLQNEIAERVRTEAALRDAEERSRRMIETARDLVFVIDPDGRIVSLNPVFESITGWDRAAWVGRPLQELLHPDDGARAAAALPLVLGDRESETQEYRFLTREGGFVVGEVLSFPLVERGAVVGAIGFARDVTARTRLEAQLRQAQKMEAVGHLAGGIAHDFNNILTAIIGYASLVELKLPPGASQRADVARILESADKAARLTQSLLAFSRKQVVAPRPVDINEVVNAVGVLLAPLIGEQVALRVEPCADPLVVVADRSQLEQVVLNLVTNARDAMTEGGTLDISTFAAAGDVCPAGARTCAVLRVADTGRGMDRQTQERIFEPFFTTKESGKGTGLGLAVVYGIVAQHGGRIACASSPGSGTTFTIALPLAPADAVPGPDPERASTASTAPRLPARATILLVEDNRAVLDSTRALLESDGFTVIAADGGRRGLELFLANQDRVDLVVTDLMMPAMNGRELRDAVQALRPDVKVLFISGYAADLLSERGLIGPDVHFLAKPLRREDLLNKVREIIGA